MYPLTTLRLSGAGYGAIVAVATVFCCATYAHADDCSDILRPDLLSKSVSQRNAAHSQAARSWACTTTLSELQNYSASTDSDSSGGGINFLSYIGLSAQGASASSLTNEQFERWKQQNCSQGATDLNRSAYEFFAQQALDPRAISAWRACKLRQESLSCWVSPRGANQIDFHFSWRSSAIDLPIVKEFTVIKGGSIPQQLAQAGDKVFIGEATKVISRETNQDTTISLNVILSQRWTYSCVGFVPRAAAVAPPQITVSQIVGKWCRFFSDGSPSGWEVWGRASGDRFYVTDSGNAPGVKSVTPSRPSGGPVSKYPEFTFRPLSINEFEISSTTGRPEEWHRYRATPTALIYLGERDVDRNGKETRYQNSDPVWQRLTRCK
jgi:hypothetical protein